MFQVKNEPILDENLVNSIKQRERTQVFLGGVKIDG
jgi:hypothetical protein